MAFLVSVLVLQTVLTVCLFFAVSQIYARVVAIDRSVGSQRSATGVPPIRAPARLHRSQLPPRTRVAVESMGVISLLVVSPGCGSCDEALLELASSTDRQMTLVVSAYEGQFDERLRVVVDEDLARLLVANGARFPVALEFDDALTPVGEQPDQPSPLAEPHPSRS